jgi:hypothetical protein
MRRKNQKQNQKKTKKPKKKKNRTIKISKGEVRKRSKVRAVKCGNTTAKTQSSQLAEPTKRVPERGCSHAKLGSSGCDAHGQPPGMFAAVLCHTPLLGFSFPLRR